VITYAVVGHNEAELLANPLAQVHEARRPGEPVWFVDSDSTDGSGELARSLGAEVIHAPRGKGRAVAAAIERCETEHICLIDADLESTTENTPATLARAIESTGADMVVGEFLWPEKPFHPVTLSIWTPLATAFFPEAVEAVPRVPLSGFRVFDLDVARGPLPPGFGLEVHLDIVGSLDGRRTETVDIGVYAGTVRGTPSLPGDIGAAILDLAERRGLLSPAARPLWDAWLEPVIDLIPVTAPDDTPARERLAAAAARPLPDTGVVPAAEA